MQEEFAPCASLRGSSTGVVARVESLPLTTFGDFVRGRMGESARQVENLFESLLARSFGE
jgi:hypothetical protein